MSLVTYLVAIPSFVPQLATMIGFGVGIDYALFLVTRHREHLAQGMTVEESAGRAVATAGQAVIFAGGTVVIAILGLAVAGIPFLTAAGIGVAVVVLIMVVASVTLLPALLGLAGRRIDRFGFRRMNHGAVGPGWRRWGEHVTGHAGKYAIGVTVLLLALTAPVLDLRLGSPDDGNLSEARTERRAYDLAARAFGPRHQRPVGHRGRQRRGGDRPGRRHGRPGDRRRRTARDQGWRGDARGVSDHRTPGRGHHRHDP